MSAEDRWLAAWVSLLVFAAAFMIAVNAAFYHFTGIWYFPRPAAAVVPPLLELVAFSLHARRLSPRAAFAIRNYASFLLLACAISLLTTGIQYTPFSSIDASIATWDQSLHYSVACVVAWTHGHRLLLKIMELSYPALNAEVFLVPLLAALCMDSRRMRVFLYAMAYSYLAGGLCYYFFPSSGPASLLTSPYFSWEQRMTGTKFYQVHHFEEVKTLLGGMVAFPSFHAVWALLLTYVAGSSAEFFLPVSLLNFLVILSTLLLGWHFLADVAASAVLAAASLWAAEATHRRLVQATLRKR